MARFGFVILHYISFKDTKECVESIINRINSDNYDIIIVDNNSPNDSLEELHNRFDGIRNIWFIENKKNYGFSKGNNAGIHFARNNLQSDFVIVINNDICVLQDNMLSLIEEEYNYSNFAVLGPKIHDPDGYNTSNPGESTIPSYKETKHGINYWRKSLIKCVINEIVFFWKRNTYIIKKNRHIPTIEEINNSNVRKENCRLHGCCLIMSPRYFEYFDGFLELTFMYAEESILFLNLTKLSLKSVYNPSVSIFHKEAIVSNKAFSGKKYIKKCYYMLQASKAFRREYIKLFGKE